ncbi:hypothetical protein QBC47DRAFT_32982 [Echria macrotheca]|uniref:Uncharacterized protein n=1 Tax=Echria macrotheca TaxID=438768 RepID=A0AAJ0F839_9PEZI|nr:hypothetical protein QBC47DRAFT_32982 [Echria macrotheca]
MSGNKKKDGNTEASKPASNAPKDEGNTPKAAGNVPKTAGNAAKPSSKVSKIFDALNKICGIAKELKEDSLGVEEFGRLVEIHARLNSDLEAKEAQLEALRKEKDEAVAKLSAEVNRVQIVKDGLWKDFEKKQREYNHQMDRVVGVEEKYHQVRGELEEKKNEAVGAKKECKKLQADLSRQGELLKKKDNMLKKVELEKRDLEIRWADAEEQYGELKGFLREDVLDERDHEEIGDVLEEFAVKCHNTVLSCVLAVSAPPLSIPTPTGYLNNLPLSSSTTRPACLMRCALVEYVFSKALADHILVDIPLPHAPDLQRAISTVCRALQSKNPRREALVRVQLLTEFGNEEAPAQAIGNALRDVCANTEMLFPVGRVRDDFVGKIEGLLQEATVIWEPLRASRSRINTELRLEHQSLEVNEDLYMDYGGQTGDLSRADPLVPLFPEFTVGYDDVLCPAKALWSGQSEVVAAVAEMEVERQVARPQDATKSMLRRRLSMRQPARQGSGSPQPARKAEAGGPSEKAAPTSKGKEMQK